METKQLYIYDIHHLQALNNVKFGIHLVIDGSFYVITIDRYTLIIITIVRKPPIINPFLSEIMN